MTERDMKRLSRLELLEILLAQGKEIERLRAQIGELEQRLARTPVQAAAVSAMRFPAAEAPAGKSAVLWEEEPASAAVPEAGGKPTPMPGDSAVSDILAEAKKLLQQAEDLSRETEQLCQQLQSRTEEECAATLESAKVKAKAYWNEVSSWVRESTSSGQWEGQK